LSTNPDVVRIFVNVTNMGATPISMIVVTDILPDDWYWHPEVVQVQFIQEDETVIEIGVTYFTTSYDPDTRTLTAIVHDVMLAAGKYLEKGEKIRIMFNMHYELKGEPLPTEYEISPPTYTNVATATAWISGWSSELATSSAEIGRASCRERV